jgi:TonB family protein
MNAWGAGLESFLLTYLLNSLWQVPLLFLAALAAARLVRPMHPRVEHRIWVGALLLQVLLPLCHLHLNELGQQAWGLVLWLRHAGAADGQTRVQLGAGTTVSMDLPWPVTGLLATVAAAFVCSMIYCAGRLSWGLWTTERMRRSATPVEAPLAAARMANFRRVLHAAPEAVRFAASPDFPGPAAVGIRQPTLLLPCAFLENLGPAELDAVLAHELAHMVRRDFLKNLLYGIITLPAAWHPVLWLTRARVAESRELVCDAMAAEVLGGREFYAKSLLKLAWRLHDRKAPRLLHAIGILDANIFERRIMNLTRKSLQLGRARQWAIAATCAVIVAAACTSALALRMDVKAPPADSKAPTSINVKPSAMTIVNKVQPVYPPDAKKAKVSGSVLLSAVIGKDGTVEKLSVIKSVRADVDTSALDAVRQWRYQPFLLNGDPVEVKTTISVVYSLAK